MTHRNNKRTDRRQRNSKPKYQFTLEDFLRAINDVFGKKNAEPQSSAISNEEIRKINSGMASLSKVKVPVDGSAVELPVPDNYQVFTGEDGKTMIRQKVADTVEPKADGKPLTYDDIAKSLYKDKEVHFWDTVSETAEVYDCKADCYRDLSNCQSKAQVKRLMAFNKLQNIAVYLNDGWHPDFRNDKKNWCVVYEGFSNKYTVFYSLSTYGVEPYFKSKEAAEAAIRIMGKQSLDDLFNPVW